MDADPALVAALLAGETDLLRPAVRRSRAALEALLAADFGEIGRSGRRYDRDAIVAALAAEDGGGRGDPAEPVARIEGFTVRLLAPGVALATYRSVHPGSPDDATSTAAASPAALRSSIWRREPDGAWRMTFHQGTPAG